MNNELIREYAKERGVKLWQIADKLNMSDAIFSRMLRHQFSEDKTAKIIQIIDKIAKNNKE